MGWRRSVEGCSWLRVLEMESRVNCWEGEGGAVTLGGLTREGRS